MDKNISFKSETFGGYQKQEVDAFLESVRKELDEKTQRLGEREEAMTSQTEELLTIKQYLYEAEKRQNYLEENYSRSWSAAQNRIASLTDENKRIGEQLAAARKELEASLADIAAREEKLKKDLEVLAKREAAAKEAEEKLSAREAQIAEEVSLLEDASAQIESRREELNRAQEEHQRGLEEQKKAIAQEEISAQAQAEKIVCQARKEAEEMRADARKELERARLDAETQVKESTEHSQAQAGKVLSQAKTQAERIVEEARAQAESVIREANQEADDLRARAWKEYQEGSVPAAAPEEPKAEPAPVQRAENVSEGSGSKPASTGWDRISKAVRILRGVSE